MSEGGGYDFVVLNEKIERFSERIFETVFSLHQSVTPIHGTRTGAAGGVSLGCLGPCPFLGGEGLPDTFVDDWGDWSGDDDGGINVGDNDDDVF